MKVDRAVERSGHKISVTKTPAGWRWVDQSPETADMVTHYADRHAQSNKYDLVFPTKTGSWQTVNNWRRMAFTAACFEAGLVERAEASQEEKPGLISRLSPKPCGKSVAKTDIANSFC